MTVVSLAHYCYVQISGDPGTKKVLHSTAQKLYRESLNAWDSSLVWTEKVFWMRLKTTSRIYSQLPLNLWLSASRDIKILIGIKAHTQTMKHSPIRRSKAAQESISFSFWGILECSQTRWDMQSFQHVLGLLQGLPLVGHASRTSTGRSQPIMHTSSHKKVLPPPPPLSLLLKGKFKG